MKRIQFQALSLAALLALSVVPRVATGQTFWIQPDQTATITLEAAKPLFDSDAFSTNPDFLSSALNITSRAPIGPILAVVELPVSYYNDDGANFDKKFSLGNPYLGVEYLTADDLVLLEVGARPPFVSSDQNGILSGLLGDIERVDAYAPGAWCYVAGGNILLPVNADGPFALRLRGAFVGSVLEGDRISNADYFVNWGGQVWLNQDAVSLGAGIMGRTIISDTNISDRTVELVGMSGSYDFGFIEPGLQVRVPIDKELRDTNNATVAIHLRIPMQ